MPKPSDAEKVDEARYENLREFVLDLQGFELIVDPNVYFGSVNIFTKDYYSDGRKPITKMKKNRKKLFGLYNYGWEAKNAKERSWGLPLNVVLCLIEIEHCAKEFINHQLRPQLACAHPL
jgi:hypothetical protein